MYEVDTFLLSFCLFDTGSHHMSAGITGIHHHMWFVLCFKPLLAELLGIPLGDDRAAHCDGSLTEL